MVAEILIITYLRVSYIHRIYTHIHPKRLVVCTDDTKMDCKPHKN